MGRKPPRLRVGAFISCEYAYKPGSVLIVIYLRVPSPVRSSHLGSSRAGLCSHTGVAPDRVYSDGRFHTPSGELLPRLSTLTRRHGAGRRYISVALFLKSPWRALPAILALWSPDFPHGRAFALSPRLSSVLAGSILPKRRRKVNENLPNAGDQQHFIRYRSLLQLVHRANQLLVGAVLLCRIPQSLSRRQTPHDQRWPAGIFLLR